MTIQLRTRAPRRLLSIPEAAEYLGLKASTVRQWVWLRKIDCVRVGRSVRIAQDVLDRLIESGTTPALQVH